MTLISLLFALIFSLVPCLSFAEVTTRPCSQLKILSAKEIDFSTTEHRLICGDPENPAYEVVPFFQVKFLLTGILQSRGFLQPTFEVKKTELYVQTGPAFYLENFEIVGVATADVADNLKRQIERFYGDSLLTPKLLDSIQGYSKTFLMNRGFACVAVTSEMIIAENQVRLLVTNLKPYLFGEIQVDQVEGLRHETFLRYRPFKKNYFFRQELVDLYEKRILRAGIVQGTYFASNCEEDQLTLTQSFVMGPPRVFRFGIGANTEVGPIARVRWTHQRYGDLASRLDASVQTSFREQTLTLTADSYLTPNIPRLSLLSQIELNREKVSDFEEVVFKMRPHASYSHDTTNAYWSFLFGPTLLSGYYRIDQQKQKFNQTSGILEGGVRRTSHNYELYDLHPEAGSEIDLSFDFRHPSFGFQDRLLKLDFSWIGLNRLAESGRGHFIGGLKLVAGTVIIPRDFAFESLPPSVKYYGGGSEDLRGFKLKSVPFNDGAGALTKVLIKSEIRRTAFFHDALESVAFVDIARFGQHTAELEPRLYYSPGLGLRWQSPIGIVQTYVSKSLLSKPREDQGYLFFLGFGGKL